MPLTVRLLVAEAEAESHRSVRGTADPVAEERKNARGKDRQV